MLDLQYRSFIGMQPIPIVYGLTIGEYASMLLGEGWIFKHKEVTKESKKEEPRSEAPMALAAAATLAAEPEALSLSLEQPEAIVSKSCDDELLNQKLIEQGGFSLIVICCKNYTHRSLYELPIKPSPNMKEEGPINPLSSSDILYCQNQW